MTKEPTRILRIIARLNIGGPAIQAVMLTKELSNDAYMTLLVCGKVSPGEGDMTYLADDANVEPFIIPELGRELSFLNDIKSFLKLRNVIKRFNPDIVHTHTAKAGTLGRLAAVSLNITTPLRKKIRLVHTFHGHVFHSYFSRLKAYIFIQIEKFLGIFTDRIIVISNIQKEDICHRYEISSDKKVALIPLGFDLSNFTSAQRFQQNARKTYCSEMSENVFCVGIIGRLTPVKNHQMLFKAIRHLKSQKKLNHFKFIIVGDGELKENLIIEAEGSDILENILFTGWQKDMPPVYETLDAVVLTSQNEGTPVTLIEAMAAKIPVIATQVGGVPDLLGSAKESIPPGFKIAARGILVPPNNPVILAAALLYLKQNREQFDRILQHAEDYVLANYSMERLAGDIQSLYAELL
ncbi:glycosyltransferase [Thermodesulfobacteriota bacterium]